MKYRLTDNYLEKKKSRRRVTLIFLLLLATGGLLLSIGTIVNHSKAAPIAITYTVIMFLAAVGNHRVLTTEIKELTEKTIDITDEAITEITATRICRFPLDGISKLVFFSDNPRNEARFHLFTKTGSKYFFEGFENKDQMMEELTSIKDKVKIVLK